MYIFLNGNSIIKADANLFKDPSSLQEAFRAFKSYEMSHMRRNDLLLE